MALVRATHSFLPKNNDELKFERGDIIVLTQKIEGGWWEGTLNGITGYFPSNYVQEIEHDGQGEDTLDSSIKKSSSSELNQQQIENRMMILSDLLESESAYHLELKGMWDKILLPLAKVDFLTSVEYKFIIGNIEEIIKKSEDLINLIKAEISKPPNEHRIGKIFLDHGPDFEKLYLTYFENHPKAVQTIDLYKDLIDVFMESQSHSVDPKGSILLIMALGQPILRSTKYPVVLQELERNVEDWHMDRGHIQRSLSVFKDIEKTCSNIRKQKEMKLEVLNGSIKNWEGTDVGQLGHILHMGFVNIGSEVQQPRYLVLFPNTILILSLDGSSLVYEGKIPITGISLSSNELNNSFEITGPMIESIFVTCQTPEEKMKFVEHLNKITRINRFTSISTSHGSTTISQSHELTPPIQASWNITNLRVPAPYNPFLIEFLKYGQNQRDSAVVRDSIVKMRNSNSPTPSVQVHVQNNINDDDFAVLALVDSFCAKNRQMSATHDVIQLDKLAEKSDANLSDIVITLRDEVSTLRSSMTKLVGQLGKEDKVNSSNRSSVNRIPSPRPFDPQRLKGNKNKDKDKEMD